jgi:hypothetical protein
LVGRCASSTPLILGVQTIIEKVLRFVWVTSGSTEKHHINPVKSILQEAFSRQHSAFSPKKPKNRQAFNERKLPAECRTLRAKLRTAPFHLASSRKAYRQDVAAVSAAGVAGVAAAASCVFFECFAVKWSEQRPIRARGLLQPFSLQVR